MKCLKWPETYPKWIWGDLEHFEICARTDARTYAYACVFWPAIDRTDIDLDHGKYEWEMAFSYEVMIIWDFPKKTQNGAWMTSWRLDDLEKVPVTSYGNDLWLCQNWKKLTGRILSYRRNKKVEEIKTRNLIRHGDELGGLSSSLMRDYNIYYIEKGRSYIDM